MALNRVKADSMAHYSNTCSNVAVTVGFRVPNALTNHHVTFARTPAGVATRRSCKVCMLWALGLRASQHKTDVTMSALSVVVASERHAHKRTQYA